MSKPVYITIKELNLKRVKKVFRTLEMKDGIFIDVDEDNNVYGIEILKYKKIEIDGQQIR